MQDLENKSFRPTEDAALHLTRRLTKAPADPTFEAKIKIVQERLSKGQRPVISGLKITWSHEED